MVGTVIRNQALMVMTFDDDTIEYLTEVLASALEESYRYLDFFQFQEEEESLWG